MDDKGGFMSIPVTPNSNEKMVEDFLVSKTDTKGKIIYCNQAFIDISGYEERELIGKPHNIVRHPDMPRTIFKYLWDNIKSGHEVNAYVKNLAKDGSYYWVFANVSPSFSSCGKNIVSYNSVRRKPKRSGLKIIEEFYTQLKQEEAKGLDSALKWFEEYFAARQDKYENAILCMQSDNMCLAGKV